MSDFWNVALGSGPSHGCSGKCAVHFNSLHLGQGAGEVQLIFNLIFSFPFLLKNTAAIMPRLGIGKFFSHFPLQVCVCRPHIAGNASAAAQKLQGFRLGQEELSGLLVQRFFYFICLLPHLGLILGTMIWILTASHIWRCKFLGHWLWLAFLEQGVAGILQKETWTLGSCVCVSGDVMAGGFGYLRDWNSFSDNHGHFVQITVSLLSLLPQLYRN